MKRIKSVMFLVACLVFLSSSFALACGGPGQPACTDTEFGLNANVDATRTHGDNVAGGTQKIVGNVNLSGKGGNPSAGVNLSGTIAGATESPAPNTIASWSYAGVAGDTAFKGDCNPGTVHEIDLSAGQKNFVNNVIDNINYANLSGGSKADIGLRKATNAGEAGISGKAEAEGYKSATVFPGFVHVEGEDKSSASGTGPVTGQRFSGEQSGKYGAGFQTANKDITLTTSTDFSQQWNSGSPTTGSFVGEAVTKIEAIKNGLQLNASNVFNSSVKTNK